MRTFKLAALASLLAATSLFAQQPNTPCPDCDPGGLFCYDYNDFYGDTINPPPLLDTKYHPTGNHQASWIVNQGCQYIQSGGQLPNGMWPCVTTSSTNITLNGAGDTGTYQLQNNGYMHDVGTSSITTSTGRGSTSSSYGVLAIAVNGCYSNDPGCGPINIQWNGLSPTYPLHEGNNGSVIYTDSELTNDLTCPPLSSDYYSPIVIDLESKNFDDAFTSAEDGVTWDFVGHGNLVRLAWTNPNRNIGFLVLDRNHNGRIDNGKELFGNVTHQASLNKQEAQLAKEMAATHQYWHPNGFLALEFFDRKENGGNENGKIDAGDTVFSELRVWVDTAHDANSRDGKMYTLDELGIKSISLAYSESPRTDKYGNKLRYQGTIQMEKVGATVPQIYDVFFKSGKQ
jgi:hypothetical protein